MRFLVAGALGPGCWLAGVASSPCVHARGRLAQALLGRRLKKPNPLLLPSAIQTRDFPLKSRLQQLVTRVTWALPVPVEDQVPRQRGCCLPHKLPEAPPQPRASEPYFRVSAYPVLYSESTQRCWTGWCAPAGPPGVEAGCALPEGAHPLALGTVIAICSVRSFHLSPLPLRVQRTGTWSRVLSGANGIRHYCPAPCLPASPAQTFQASLGISRPWAVMPWPRNQELGLPSSPPLPDNHSPAGNDPQG